jgi:trk system potassium uptake protein
MLIHAKPISDVVGVLLILLGIGMWLCLPFSWHYDSGDAEALFYAGLVSIGVGAISWWYLFPGKVVVNKREGYLIVALGWIAMCLFSALPYMFWGGINGVTNAVFEATSGLTTTGATILRDIEIMPEGLLVWRSLTQWIGGMGIIVLTIALMPLLGIGGVELFTAEAPGPTSDKIHPRIRETAKRLWWIYVGLTVLLFVLLSLEGMPVFDSINHALTTMATGGFSTKNASIAAFPDPLIQYTIIFFMFIAGTNYTVLYFLIMRKFKLVSKNDEYRFYLILLLIFCLIVSLGVWWNTGQHWEQSMRDGLFQVVSIVTTTGFVTADYTQWGGWLYLFFFALLFVGACAGSTSGGIKLVRHLVFLKNSILEFKRILHPRAMIRIKINNLIVAPRILTHILVFLLVYLITFIVGSVTVSFLGMDFESAIGAVATSLGNVGPAIGSVGPVNNFADVPESAKWVLSFLMVLGRLELFTILVLFTPYFWRSN